MGAGTLDKDRLCCTCRRGEGPDEEGEPVRLERCVICHRWYCEDHAAEQSGRTFCSKRCADYFFFADPED